MTDRLADRDDARACRRVLLRFLASVDEGHATSALDLFGADAEFDARGEAIRGRAAIAAFLAAREAETDRHTLHVVVNDEAGLAADGQVVITATVMLYERDRAGGYGLARVLATTQTFGRDPDGRWRITQRRTRPLHP